MADPFIPVRCHQGYLEVLTRKVHADIPLLLPGSTLKAYESSYHIGPPLKITQDNNNWNESVRGKLKHTLRRNCQSMPHH